MLYWSSSSSDYNIQFKVYLEAGDATPDIMVSENDYFIPSYHAGILDTNTLYYWQIEVISPTGVSEYGPVWSFTTGNNLNVLSEMITIPAGIFQMGCAKSRWCSYSFSADQLPLHAVNLSTYLIDKYEVTNAQYAECVAARVCAVPDKLSSQHSASYYDNPNFANYPVIYVSWQDASNYCAWAGKRLPTEAEWEKAARGSNVIAYPWGDKYPHCGLANLGFGELYCVGDTSPVGSYIDGASPYGVMDLVGNVEEWVNDWYQEDYYSSSPETNPSGPSIGDTKVLRGTYFRGTDETLALRNHEPIDTHTSVTGFRCAASP